MISSTTHTPGPVALHVPDRAHIRRVDESDPLPYYYLPGTAWLFRQRLRLALELLNGGGPYESVLEAGYGSGILLPTLRRLAGRVHAMDLHQNTGVVQSMLHAEGVDATLSVGDVRSLAYASGQFDAVVCISTLEHLHGPDLDAAVREMRRVLRPGGVAVLGVPASGWIMDALFRVIGFSEIGEHHVSTHHDIADAISTHFTQEAERHLPGMASRRTALYTVYRGRAR